MRRRVATVGGLAALGVAGLIWLAPAAGQEPAVASAERGGSGCSVASVPVLELDRDRSAPLAPLSDQRGAGDPRLRQAGAQLVAAEGSAAAREDDGRHRLPRPPLSRRGRPRHPARAGRVLRRRAEVAVRREHRLRAERRGDGRQLDRRASTTGSTSSIPSSTTSGSGSRKSASTGAATRLRHLRRRLRHRTP